MSSIWRVCHTVGCARAVAVVQPKNCTATAKRHEGVVVRSIKVDAEGRQATGSLGPSAKDGARKENARMAAFSGGSKSC